MAMQAAFLIFGLVDPSTHRIFHVDYSTNLDSFGVLPEPVAARVAAIAPATPHIVVLESVNSQPKVAWIKWSQRFRRDILASDWKRHTGILKFFINSKRTR